MTVAQLKADLEATKKTIETLDQSLPGAAAANATIDKIVAVAENPFVLDLLAYLLTREGF